MPLVTAGQKLGEYRSDRNSHIRERTCRSLTFPKGDSRTPLERVGEKNMIWGTVEAVRETLPAPHLCPKKC